MADGIGDGVFGGVGVAHARELCIVFEYRDLNDF